MSRPLAIAIATLMLMPAAADATTYRGKTSQGRAASIRTGADGIVNRVRISWRAPCGQNKRFVEATVFRPPFDMATGDALRDGGTYRIRSSGIVGRITIAVTARRDAARNTWRGTLRVNVQVARRGRVIDRCRLQRVTWRARPVG
jgi:hypothetical protein